MKSLTDAKGIRENSKGDWDGNGRIEGVPSEVENLKRDLYAAIQQYARTVSGTPVAFTPDGYPYWYADTNGNGKIDKEEFRPDNGFKAFTPRLQQAIYNYTFVLRDPGAACHNGSYAAQLLYDSIESLASSGKIEASIKGKTRPAP